MLEKVCTRILGVSREMLKGLVKMELMVGGGSWIWWGLCGVGGLEDFY